MQYTIPPNVLKKLYSLQIRVVKFADTTGQISRYKWSNSPKFSFTTKRIKFKILYAIIKRFIYLYTLKVIRIYTFENGRFVFHILIIYCKQTFLVIFYRNITLIQKVYSLIKIKSMF